MRNNKFVKYDVSIVLVTIIGILIILILLIFFLYLTYYRASIRIKKVENDTVLAAKAICGEILNPSSRIGFVLNTNAELKESLQTACRQLTATT